MTTLATLLDQAASHLLNTLRMQKRFVLPDNDDSTVLFLGTYSSPRQLLLIFICFVAACKEKWTKTQPKQIGPFDGKSCIVILLKKAFLILTVLDPFESTGLINLYPEACNK